MTFSEVWEPRKICWNQSIHVIKTMIEVRMLTMGFIIGSILSAAICNLQSSFLSMILIVLLNSLWCDQNRCWHVYLHIRKLDIKWPAQGHQIATELRLKKGRVLLGLHILLDSTGSKRDYSKQVHKPFGTPHTMLPSHSQDINWCWQAGSLP